MKSGIIRTPMPALQTFIDDPLRVLRVIRFATRFNYQLDQDILNAVQNKDIQDSFSKKITRERIGVEVDKMITGPDPVRALQLIKDFGFYSLVFEPLDPLPAPINQDLCLHVMEMIHASRKLDVLGIGSFTKEQLRFLSLASTVVPVLGYTCKIKSKMCPAERGIILHSLKVLIISSIDALINNFESYIEIS